MSMPAIVIYLLKLSVSLSVVYLFYHSVLRRLTFYAWNRFYLICYTGISFFIPFINITPVLERNEMMNNKIVQFIPQVGALNEHAGADIYPTAHIPTSWSAWDFMILILFAGIAVMLLRLLVQLISFKKIMNNAQLVSDNDVKLYQVDQSIIPFSFGNSIFINRQLHNDSELQEIIRHEFVHVRQKHTLDIIWTELLCVLNWYNPFVWLTRKAIRQNLEFIADNKVLQTGIDRKQYQYLLLKVTGNNYFSIASQFNFSSLKKRIAMMNKVKSAKAHLIKFLFVLPLIAVLILSFRNKMSDIISKSTEKVFNLSGIVYDNKTEMPLPNVIMVETATGIQTKTDDRGFYTMVIPITGKEKQEIEIKFIRNGYADNDRLMEIETKANINWTGIGFFSLLANSDSRERINHAFFYSAKDQQGNILTNPGYDFVKDKFENYFKRKKYDENSSELNIVTIEDIHLEDLGIINRDTIPVNDKGYLINITGIKENRTVVVKDKNQKEVKRLLLTEWYKNSNQYEYLYGPLPVAPKDAVSAVNPDKDSGTYDIEDETVAKDFKRLELNDDLLATVTLNNGKTEKYDLNKETDKKAFEKKYSPVISALPKGNKPVKVIRSTVSYNSPEIAGVSSSSSTKNADVYIAGSPREASAVEINAEPAEPVSPARGFDNVNGNIILDIKGNMPENKVKEMMAGLKNKGYDVVLGALEYHNSKIALLKGTISANDRKNNFEASDFLRFVISDAKTEDGKKEFNFYIGSGSLVWQ